MIRPLLALLAGLLLPGCWEVLSHQEQETVWMDWNGAVAVNPSELELAAAPGEQATAELVWTETSGMAGVEFDLVLEGDAADQLAIHPGEWSVGLTPSGVLTVQVTYTAPSEASTGQAELVATTTGTPAEIRIPVTLTATTQ